MVSYRSLSYRDRPKNVANDQPSLVTLVKYDDTLDENTAAYSAELIIQIVIKSMPQRAT